MQTFEIRHRDNRAVLYSGGGESLRDVVEQAAAADANLAGANLARANLAGADLAGAQKLVGKRPVLQIGPIGSRCSYLVSYITDTGVWVRAGCWFGSLADFDARVVQKHGTSAHGVEYAAASHMIAAHARIWAPKKEASDE